MYVGISCGVLLAQGMSCQSVEYTARYKMLSGTSGQQVSRPKFGRKKTPDLSVRGWASYDMKLCLELYAKGFEVALHNRMDCAFVVQVLGFDDAASLSKINVIKCFKQ